MSLSLKFGLYRSTSTPSSHILPQSDPPPADLSLGTFYRKLRPNDRALVSGHNGEPIGNPIALLNGIIADPLTQMPTPAGPTSRQRPT